jgi:hypothetical protein
MSRIIYTNQSDHNDLNLLDQWIATLLSQQKAAGDSLEFCTEQKKRYMKEYGLTVMPSLAEISNKYGGLRRLTLRINDYTKKLQDIETQLVLAGKKKDRILGRYPEDKY